jgi:hypothetical protein
VQLQPDGGHSLNLASPPSHFGLFGCRLLLWLLLLLRLLLLWQIWLLLLWQIWLLLLWQLWLLLPAMEGHCCRHPE